MLYKVIRYELNTEEIYNLNLLQFGNYRIKIFTYYTMRNINSNT